MRVQLASLWLIGCGPVLLGHERDGGVTDDSATLSAHVEIRSAECGACFDLSAEAAGGVPPYTFEWEDGVLGAMRRLCASDGVDSPTVLVRDAMDARSAPDTSHLSWLDAACPAAPPTTSLCIMNPSFEGTPAANLGLPNDFDAVPWNTCTNPSVANTPDIVNDTIPQVVVPVVPSPTDGTTYLALGEGEQVSQALCEPLHAAESVSIRLDLLRINLAQGVVPTTEAVFLEIWSGVAADCSARELLWASPPLADTWQSYCITLRPQAFADDLTLRANSDKTQLSPAYLALDNLVPVESCP